MAKQYKKQNAEKENDMAKQAEDQPVKAAADDGAPVSYVWVRDVNFGQHKPGQPFEGDDLEEMLKKGLVAKA